MEEYQGERLRSLIRHAYETVPYYHELFSSLRLRPEDIKTPEHLKLLPIITKETVVINKPKMLSTAVPRKELVPVHTSGTTGTALAILVDQRRYRVGVHCLSGHGVGPA